MIMVVIITASILALVGFNLALAFHRQFATSEPALPVTVEWIDELSVDRYLPMWRLLGQEDLRFLRTQPGFTSQMANTFRIQRCQVFREYLRQLDSDFKCICMALKVVIVQSKHDRPDLASVLVRNQMTFAYGIMMVQFQLMCYRYGIGTVNVTGLLKLFDRMRLELRTLVPAESWTGA
jgi:hypothetical protein